MNARETNPDACLDILQSAERSDVMGGLRLGRVFWDGEVVEPVLIRKSDEQYQFRNCSGGLPTEVDIDENDLEFFNSALVAHFVPERTEALTMYREVPFLGYAPKGEAVLSFRGTGGMLEARRLDANHVEVTGTDSVQVFPTEGALERKKVAILLVATRQAMSSMGPAVWEDAWGDRPEDPQIEREIIWWELAGPGRFRVHPATRSFTDLANRATGSAGGSEGDWASVLKKSLRPMLDRAALALLVTEEPEHIELAEDMLKLASTTNSDAVLDIAALEDPWSKQQHVRLEGAASRGRYWLLTRLYDLAAIMPDRIAGKVRRSYYQSALRFSSTGIVDVRFAKDYVTLAKEPSVLQVANAVYQDQAAGMAKIMSFLGCLLTDADETLGGRTEALEEGLELMDIPVDDLKSMDVRKAFQYLFQGFSLPADLRAGERNFLASISSGDPEVLRLVRLLQASFANASLNAHAACEVALIPDDLLLGRPIEEAPVMVVASMPTPALTMPTVTPPVVTTTEPPVVVATTTTEPPVTTTEPSVTTTIEPPVTTATTEPPVTTMMDPPITTTEEPPVVVATLDPRIGSLFEDARLAARKARVALADAIEAKGSRHTQRRIRRGNELLDHGRALMDQEHNPATLAEAVRTFEQAERIYLEAKETSWRKEHSKPKLRVH